MVFTVLAGVVLTANGETIVIDDFNDGNEDGWTHVTDIPASRPWGPGIFDASSGAYHLGTTGVVGSGFLVGGIRSAWDRSSDAMFADGIWRTTLRVDNAGTEAGFVVRFDPKSVSGYVFGLDAPSQTGQPFFLRADRGVPAMLTYVAVPGVRIRAGEDWILEAGAVGDLITMKAWPASQPEPDSPQFTLTDARYDSGLFAVGSSGYQGWQNSATFDDISFTAPDPFLQAGDADQDLDFDQLDLVLVQIAAKYLSGEAAAWREGDWNGAPGGTTGNPPTGNGFFDQLDVVAALTAGVYLTGPYAAVASGGVEGDSQTSIVYDANSGEITVDAPAATQLTSINIDSKASVFTGEAAQNLGGSFDNDADNNIFKATFGSSFGSLSFGNVAQAGLSEEFILGDLTVIGSLAGGGALGNVDLIYVPEPSSSLLLMIGAAIGLLRIPNIGGRR
jgi:hypothetical protein